MLRKGKAGMLARMSTRTPFVAANWKMNPPPQAWDVPDSPYREIPGVDVAVFPTALDLRACIDAGIVSGGQAGRPEPTGAFTGDVSMRMLKEAGCRYVLCGHSERRMHHGETDEMVGAQAAEALEAGLLPIVCVGETGDQREMGEAEETVRRQIEATGETDAIIAYEPVWAIGTGKTATPADAQAMHAFIRGLLPAGRRESTRILYGGSVKPGNAAELIAQADIDGFLVGGASLLPSDFRAIIDCCAPKA